MQSDINHKTFTTKILSELSILLEIYSKLNPVLDSNLFDLKDQLLQIEKRSTPNSILAQYQVKASNLNSSHSSSCKSTSLMKKKKEKKKPRSPKVRRREVAQ